MPFGVGDVQARVARKVIAGPRWYDDQGSLRAGGDRSHGGDGSGAAGDPQPPSAALDSQARQFCGASIGSGEHDSGSHLLCLRDEPEAVDRVVARARIHHDDAVGRS